MYIYVGETSTPKPIIQIYHYPTPPAPSYMSSIPPSCLCSSCSQLPLSLVTLSVNSVHHVSLHLLPNKKINKNCQHYYMSPNRSYLPSLLLSTNDFISSLLNKFILSVCHSPTSQEFFASLISCRVTFNSPDTINDRVRLLGGGFPQNAAASPSTEQTITQPISCFIQKLNKQNTAHALGIACCEEVTDFQQWHPTLALHEANRRQMFENTLCRLNFDVIRYYCQGHPLQTILRLTRTPDIHLTIQDMRDLLSHSEPIYHELLIVSLEILCSTFGGSYLDPSFFPILHSLIMNSPLSADQAYHLRQSLFHTH
jgi:hypothetical protein